MPINIFVAISEDFQQKDRVCNMVAFADNLKYLRREAGMTQSQLAKCIRVRRRVPSRCYITQLESGRLDPQLATVRSIARALHLKPWQLTADLSDNVEFWRGYLNLNGTQKREVQRHIDWLLRRAR